MNKQRGSFTIPRLTIFKTNHKTMKNYIILLVFLFSTTIANAQQYRIKTKSDKIIFNVSSVTIEGYDGDEVTFSSTIDQSEVDPKADGLKLINSAAPADNTKLGINVTQTESALIVNQVASSTGIKVLVPKKIMLSITSRDPLNSGKIELKNVSSEIEIAADYNKIILVNVSGPIAIRTLYGAVDIILNSSIKGPIAIASVYSAIDVSLPSVTKANLRLNGSIGKILTDPKLDITLEKNTSIDIKNYENLVKGKINGGGPEINLSSEYAKIYVRTIN